MNCEFIYQKWTIYFEPELKYYIIAKYCNKLYARNIFIDKM
jgi:hypothetical protein